MASLDCRLLRQSVGVLVALLDLGGLCAARSGGLRDNDFARPKKVSIQRERARTEKYDNSGHDYQVDGNDNTTARTSTGCQKPEDAIAEVAECRQGTRNWSEYPEQKCGANDDTEQAHAQGADGLRTRCGNQARHLAETAEGDSQPQEKKADPGPSVREADKKLQLTHP